MCFIQFLHWTNWLLLVTLSNFHFQGRVFWDFLQKEATAMAKIPVVLAIHATNDRLSSYDDVSILVSHGIKLCVAVGTWLKQLRTIRLGELISPFFIWELRSTSRQLWNNPVFVIYISSIFIYHFISIREFHASGTIFNFKVGEDTLPLRFENFPFVFHQVDHIISMVDRAAQRNGESCVAKLVTMPTWMANSDNPRKKKRRGNWELHSGKLR